MENVEFTFGKGVNFAWRDSAARKDTILSKIWFIYAELIPLTFLTVMKTIVYRLLCRTNAPA